MKPTVTTIITGFLLLFACYHLAEYMVLSRNSPLGFLFFSFAFFPLAFFIVRWQGDKNLKRWGLAIHKTFPVYLLTGLLTGLIVSVLLFITCLVLDVEVVRFIPPVQQFLPKAALLVFGCALSSLTEDVLTRGYLFRHAKAHWSRPVIVIFSALVYALNHIHRLNEPVYFLYAFVLGVQLVIPLLVTGNIWYTLGVHWAGNIVYHITNSVMHTSGGSNPFPGIVIAIIFAVLSIPLHYLVCRSLAGEKPKKPVFPMQEHSSAFMRHLSGLI